MKAGQAYCVKCRKGVTPKNPKLIKRKKGPNMLQGECPTSGTKVTRFVARDYKE